MKSAICTPSVRASSLVMVWAFFFSIVYTTAYVPQKPSQPFSGCRHSVRTASISSHPSTQEEAPRQKRKWLARKFSRKSNKADRKAKKFFITTPEALEEYWKDKDANFRNNPKDPSEIDYTQLLNSADVKGDTQIIGTPDYTHPVVQLVHDRKRERMKSTSSTAVSKRPKIALAIEGGGMRGCVSGGAMGAIHYLNLTDCIDVVYGSSAGAIIGSYLITDQLPWFGPELYYDKLTTAGRDFIDTRRLLRAIGLGLLDPRLLKDVMTRPALGKPVLNLSFLLETTLQQTKPLNWTEFVAKQSTIPLNVVVSDLKSESARVLSMKNGDFESLSELAQAMHASCLLPGIAGPLMNLNMNAKKSNYGKAPKYVLGNDIQLDHVHPLADALVYEALPFHSAIREGATHVIVVRSRPDGVDVTGKSNFLENLIYKRFFLRKNKLPRIYDRFKRYWHKKIYADDVLFLNQHAESFRHYSDMEDGPHLMTIAAPPGSPEVPRLETGRQAIFEGMRRGFARAYDCLVEDPAERGRGMEVARQVFPDEILEYDPQNIDTVEESAYAFYRRLKHS